MEIAMPGVLVDGQFRRGVSVGDCVAAGETIATRAAAWLQSSGDVYPPHAPLEQHMLEPRPAGVAVA
jgi:hypothetical protein